MGILISVILLFTGVGLLILIHFCVVGRAFRRGFLNGADNRNNNNNSNNSNRSESMSREDVEKLPCFDFEVQGSPADCAVCLDNLKAGDKCRLLPQCRHSFHKDCVDLWLLKAPVCPICRTNASGRFCADDLDGIVIAQTEDIAENRVSTSIADQQPVQLTLITTTNGSS